VAILVVCFSAVVPRQYSLFTGVTTLIKHSETNISICSFGYSIRCQRVLHIQLLRRDEDAEVGDGHVQDDPDDHLGHLSLREEVDDEAELK
jgi:hypothetical protein